jgi:hypothetical protein
MEIKMSEVKSTRMQCMVLEFSRGMFMAGR